MEWKSKKKHLKSKAHLNTERAVNNKYTIMNPEFCERNNFSKENVSDYGKNFVIYKNKCN